MKIQNFWNKFIQQKIDIEDQTEINESNIDNISIVNSINQFIKITENLSTEWVTLSQLSSETFFPITSAEIEDRSLAYEWIIDLGILPEFIIPYIKIKILYRSPENLPQRAFDDNNIQFITNFIFQGEELEDAGITDTKFTLIAKIFVFHNTSDELNIEDVEAKLLISIQNPYNFL